MAQPASDPRIGIEINGPENQKFRIEQFLGQGAFGAVFRATGLSSSLRVAVKVLPLHDTAIADQSTRTALLNEIENATQINHENVVRVLHVERDSEALGPYLVMEYIEGGTLASLLESARQSGTEISLSQALIMMRDIARGASAVNSRLIHRDIRPENILWDGARFRVSDFGISKVLDAHTRSHTFKGRQHFMYMAPEGWREEANTPKIDVYSAGLVFFEILTLGHPLETHVTNKDDWRAWEHAHLFRVCPDIRSSRANVPVSISQLLLRMVAKRPQDRPVWEEVLRVLEAEPSMSTETIVERAVQAALRRQNQTEKDELEKQEATAKENQQQELYKFSAMQLVSLFGEVVEEFNEQFQFGSIRVVQDGGTWVYRPPNADPIFLYFFPRTDEKIRIRDGQLVGGGCLAIRDGPSCNLILVRESEDDLYGRWTACLLRFSALVDPQEVATKIGMHLPTVQPFGLPNAKLFYEHIRWASGGMHVFTYEFRDNLKELFSDYLAWAFETGTT